MNGWFLTSPWMYKSLSLCEGGGGELGYEQRDDKCRVRRQQKFQCPYTGSNSAVENICYWQKIKFVL